MQRGPQTGEEWKQYSSYNIKILERLPIAELYALGEVLQVVLMEGNEAMDKGQISEEQLESEKLFLDVYKKRSV